MTVFTVSPLSSVQSRLGSVQLASGGGLALRDFCRVSKRSRPWLAPKPKRSPGWTSIPAVKAVMSARWRPKKSRPAGMKSSGRYSARVVATCRVSETMSVGCAETITDPRVRLRLASS